jgi:hypothetical protein
MKRVLYSITLFMVAGAFLVFCSAQDTASAKVSKAPAAAKPAAKSEAPATAPVAAKTAPAAQAVPAAPVSKAVAKAPAEASSAAKTTAVKTPATPPKAAASGSGDTLIVEARLIQIPGTFAPNDLYNYVYIMKYRIMKVVKGTYDKQEILIGEYNPLIPRRQIKDKMDKFVDGDADKFEEGVKQRLVLITPIEKVWNDAVEDEYFDSDLPKFYALKTDVLK